MKQAVKIDLNIETDLAYALKAKECPQILFLRGNRILYREKGDMMCCLNAVLFFGNVYEQWITNLDFDADFRTADELVQMIAHFYYKARRPSWIDKANVTPYC